MKLWTILVICVVMTSKTALAGSLDDTVHTTHGEVRGHVTTVVDRQVNVYWGIPYAKIPARFQRPEQADSWEGVLNATIPPPSCPGLPDTMDIPLIPPPLTAPKEDCLFLNLWSPQGCAHKGDEDGLAVMVWIHGGALQLGSSTVATYNGQVLAATQCVVVVSMNFRQGPLGFLSLGTAAAPGNVGFIDQAMALQWIHDNARNFGGDPDRITIFGESAGGLSAGAHMASPLSQQLFSRAIIQSGPVTASFGKTTASQNAAAARKLAAILDCPVEEEDAMITCLSEADATEMGRIASDRKWFSLPAFGIVVDGHFLKKPLVESFRSKDTKKLDVMIGATADDGSFIFSIPMANDFDETSTSTMDQKAFYKALEQLVFPVLLRPPRQKNLLGKMLEYLYMNSSLPDRKGSYRSALDRILTDVHFVCPMYTAVAHLHGVSNVYMYSFDHRSSISPFPQSMGVVHASEIDFVFGRPLDQSHSFTEEERQLSLLVMNAWARFAKSGNPNSDDAPTQWPPVNNATYPYAMFRSPSHIDIGQGLHYRECAFWNELYSHLHQQHDSPVGHNHEEL